MTIDNPAPPRHTSRRAFLHAAALIAVGAALPSDVYDWRILLDDYAQATRRNIVTVNGRRAMLSSWLYPGTYVRDAVFWGPLALADPALGYECYQWFAETQLPTGQIRTAIPLHPDEAQFLQPQDDEGTLLFIIDSDWLRRAGFAIDTGIVERAYGWVMAHVQDDLYISPPGPFRYWADTVSPDVPEALSHNQGLLCLARRAMRSMSLGGVTDSDVARAQAAYRSFGDGAYVHMGRSSRFADAQDISAVFPEFISRLIYDEPILSDAQTLAHVRQIVANATVNDDFGRLAGIKVISAADGSFLPPEWYGEPSINKPGDYQNGGYWPMYTLVALAMAYRIAGGRDVLALIQALVERELMRDHRSKEIIQLIPHLEGHYDRNRVNYTWNALIRTACRWASIS